MYDGKVLYNDFEKHHIEVLENKKRFNVLIWHRKSRKSTFCLKNIIREAARKVGTYWYIFPYTNQGRRVIWEDPEMLNRWIPSCAKKNDTESKLTLTNGSIVRFIGADNKEALRGSGLNGVIFDEFDDILFDTWSAVIRPMLTLTKGWVIFAGTPKGTGNLYKLHQLATSGSDPDWWASEILRAETSGLLPEDELVRLRYELNTGQLPKATYDSEYQCEFITGGSGVFRRVRENIYDGIMTPEKDRQYQIGVDLAKLNDFTVITPIDLHSWKVGIPDRFQQIDYPLIEARIESNWRKYNECGLRVESNSIGEPVCDHLQLKGIMAERFKTTEMTREAMLKNLSILIETDAIKLPDYAPLIEELEAMRYERDGKTKKIKMISSIEHDDCVISLALACWELKKIPYIKSNDSQLSKEFKAVRRGLQSEGDNFLNTL